MRGDTAPIPGIGDALIAAVDASQDLVLSQLALLRADVHDDVQRMGRVTALVLGGAALALMGHGAVVVAVGMLLNRVLSVELVLITLGAPHLLAGVLAVWWGSRPSRGPA